ncbi:MAG: Flavobacterium phage Fpv8 [Bacteroidota bacterium]|jgi:DNA (cytosine-5)-methyltransferase 1
MNKHLFPYKWFLKDGYPSANIQKNEYNVFGTFICGGGSTMGYKLAGFNHLGGVEIDPPIADVYKTNHKPKHLYNLDIREFNKLIDLPAELFNLDILDGSPPCSTFSMAGSREKAWGKEKVFREGQAKQSLDDLVFVYCDTIIKLQPKVFLLENVKGIIQGNAKVYSKNIVKKMTDAGYNVQVFCLNAASMGVPQKRERVFFIGHKKEYFLPKLKLEFSEVAIPFKFVDEGKVKRKPIRDGIKNYYKITPMGKCVSSVHPKGMYFGTYKQHPEIVSNTCIADSGGGIMLHPTEDGYLTDNEYKIIGTYPLDYNFKSIEPKYLIGMSVPPVMTAQIANQIRLQWLDKIK